MNTINWRDYLELCKPRVVFLMLITAVVGMCLASPGMVPVHILLFATVGIGCTAGAAAAINHLVDRQIDSKMRRTKQRPVATGKIKPLQAIVFAAVLGTIGTVILLKWVNTLTAWLSVATLVGYAFIYTLYLKRATPQNIVIGGLAGAAPPLLGWTAVTGHIHADALLMVLIIFTWTPPHFWALAIYREQDYANAKIPMLPVTHGAKFTKLSILLYTILLIAVTALPYAIGMSGLLYFAGAMLLGLRFLQWSIRLWRTDELIIAMKTFRFSIVYLFALFIVLLLDHYLRGII